MDRAPIDAINSEPTMGTKKKISSLEAWERQVALLAKRKQKPSKNPLGYSSPAQSGAQAQPRQCQRNATACNAAVQNLKCVRAISEPLRLAGGCLLYRFPVQLRSV